VAELTLSDIDRLRALDEADRTFQMNEDAFRVFYGHTSRPLWVYLSRMTGDSRLADDLLQEAYYRFLRADASFESEAHRRNYLFRIATNLVRDHRRRPGAATSSAGFEESLPDAHESTVADRVTRRIDLARAMDRLTPRDRSLLWLAYAQGCSHAEIAASLGLKTASLKSLLYRARQRLMRLLGPGGPR
jgi:RNA polymerase sigma-70 factor (ECF subfamily)